MEQQTAQVTNGAARAVATYFDAWKAKDFDTLQSVLADDVTFVGPLGQAEGAASYRQAMEGFAQMVTDVVVRKTFVDGPDVLTWFELHTRTAAPCPTANWSHVENGRITTVTVAFDPRPLLAPAER